MRTSQNRLSFALIASGSLLLIAALTLMSLVLTGIISSGTRGNSDLATINGFGGIMTPTPGAAPTVASSPFAPGDPSPIDRLVIVSAKVNAPVVTKGVDATGVMQSPDNAYDTAWYNFSARPGFDGNAVFAGHVDYVRVGPAVFWNLKDLNPGDVIEVRLKDGTVYRYAVKVKQQYDAKSAPIDQIVGPTAVQSVTLITCSGTFNPTTRQYDKRLVVRAERIAPGAAPAASAPGA
ncbi:MAG: class F sortase [Dehalococcoidia bacterium]|nr:class F sortase [Dehalococcoidia bacterium]